MTVEDLLTYMVQMQFDLGFTTWEASFIQSVGRHPLKGNALSTRQGETVLKIGSKYRKKMFPDGSVNRHKLDMLFRNPVYTIEPFVSEIYPREVRYAGDNLLAFRFKMNDEVKNDIKQLSPPNNEREGGGRKACFFASVPKLWIVPVAVFNVERVQWVIAMHDFAYDDAVLNLLAEVASARGVAPQAIHDPENDQIVLATTENAMLGWFAEHVLMGRPV